MKEDDLSSQNGVLEEINKPEEDVKEFDAGKEDFSKDLYRPHSKRNNFFALFLTSVVFLVLLLGIYKIFSNRFQEVIPIKIGIVTTLSGKLATAGSDSRDGVVLAIEEANAKGGVNGREIELYIEDDQSDSEVAKQAVQGLVDDGVAAIIGPLVSTVTIDVLPVLEEVNITMISPGSNTAQLSGLDDNLIRLLTPADKQAPILAKYIFNDLTLKDVVVVYDTSNAGFSDSWNSSFSNEFKNNGGKIVDSIGLSSVDGFDSEEVAQKIVDIGAEGVLFIMNAVDVASIAQELRLLDSEVQIVDSSWAGSDSSLIQKGGKAVDGIVFTNAYNEDESSLDFVELKKRFFERFGKELNSFSLLSYESTIVLLDALEETTNPSLIKDVILEKGKFKGVIGDVHIDEFGDPERKMYVKKIMDGSIENIGEINSIE